MDEVAEDIVALDDTVRRCGRHGGWTAVAHTLVRPAVMVVQDILREHARGRAYKTRGDQAAAHGAVASLWPRTARIHSQRRHDAMLADESIVRMFYGE